MNSRIAFGASLMVVGFMITVANMILEYPWYPWSFVGTILAFLGGVVTGIYILMSMMKALGR